MDKITLKVMCPWCKVRGYSDTFVHKKGCKDEGFR